MEKNLAAGIENEDNVIARLKQGDMTDFQTLYRAHFRRVFSVCRRIVRDHAMAEDLTQDTFLLVFQHIGSFRGQSAFSSWLYRLASNAAFRHLRLRKSRITEIPADDLESEENGHTSRIERYGGIDLKQAFTEERLSLEGAILQLPPGCQRIFLLHDVKGYAHEEIARMIGCSTGNTKSQLQRARRNLRRLLQPGEKAAKTGSNAAAGTGQVRGKFRRHTSPRQEKCTDRVLTLAAAA